MGVTRSHPQQRHREAPYGKVRQATPKAGRRLHGLVSHLKIRGFLLRPAADGYARLFFEVDFAPDRAGIKFFLDCAMLRHPLGATKGLKDASPAQQALDGGDGAFALSVAFNAGQLFACARRLIALGATNRLLRAVREQPLQGVFEKTGVSLVGEQPERAGFKDVWATEQRKSPFATPASDRNGQGLEADLAERVVET